MPKFPADILNDLGPAPRPQPEASHPPYKVNAAASAALLHALVRATAGFSVEQLEQMYSALMNAVWRTRGEWDRRVVVQNCQDIVVELLVEMEEIQGLGRIDGRRAYELFEKHAGRIRW